MRPNLESETLHAIVEITASEPDLDRLLRRVLALLADSTESEACFVYLNYGDRLELRAASSIFASLVGRVSLGMEEGLVGWTARTRTPAFIRDNPQADPRFRSVPEIHEERFQSMATIPIPSRSGGVLGVIVLQTESPDEFEDTMPSFLQHVVSLLAGAIENAKLLEDARRRVNSLTQLTTLEQRIAAATEREQLYRVVTEGVRWLLSCDSASLSLFREGSDVGVVASDPPDAKPDDGTFTISSEIHAGHHRLGTLSALGQRAFSDHEEELLQAIASQVAVALARTQLIEHLTSHNLLRQVFEALAAGDAPSARARATSAGFDLNSPHVVVKARALPDTSEAWAEVAAKIETGLRAIASSTRTDVTVGDVRALMPLLPNLHRSLEELAASLRVAIGVSDARNEPGGSAVLEEAHDACEVATLLGGDGRAESYESLGAYRYLVRLPVERRPHDRHTRAVMILAAYDERRRSSLLATLEEYLHRGRSAVATARGLYIHPNTLRQRLARVEALTDLRLADEDLLTLELAVKLARLQY